MGVAAVGAIAGDVLGTVGTAVVGGALTGAAISGVMGGNPLTGALTGGLGGGIMSGLTGSAGGLLNTLGGAGGVTGTAGSTLTGAEGTVLDASQVQAAINAYTSSGVPADLAAQYVATATGNSIGAVNDVLSGASGGLGLATAAQAPFSAAAATPTGLAGALKNLTGGQGTSTLGNLSSLAQVGMGAYALANQGITPTQAQQQASPWSQYASNAATQLNQLMQNPSMVYGLPGYQFAQQQGQQATARQAAATGTALSGNTLAALQQQSQATAGNWFNNYVNQLGQQAGVQNLAQGAQLGLAAQQQQTASNTAALNAIMAGVQGLGSSGFFG